jgi:hypothetical protein
MSSFPKSGRSYDQKSGEIRGRFRPEADFGDKQLTVRVEPALKAQAVVLELGSS